MKDIISKITLTDDISLITVYNLRWDIGTTADLFNKCSDIGLNVDMISQTAPQGADINLSFTVPDSSLTQVLKLTAKYKEENLSLRTDVNSSNSKLTFYGEKMRTSTGVAAFVFSLFAKANAQIKVVTTSEVEISCLTDSSNIIELKRVIKEMLNKDIEE